MNDDEKPDECQSCYYETKDLKDYPTYGGHLAGKKRWLCDLCASTNAGRALEYPDQFPDGQVMQTVCYVGNVILAAVHKAVPGAFRERKSK